MKDLTVIDFFCGAGGFSEGFRQEGFKILKGVDHWRPAIDTYNHNFGLNCSVKNMLTLSSLERIDELPNTTVILGSPPCVSFSSSNRSGNADKAMGVTLSEIFLKIVAVKKHQPGSSLKAWFMENVAKSKGHLREQYRFKDLGLADWAISIGKSPMDIAIRLAGNSAVINSADYGAPQSRKRLITGEIMEIGGFIVPPKTHQAVTKESYSQLVSLGEVRSRLPSPLSTCGDYLVQDPNYPFLRLKQSALTDHFYDTGLYQVEWMNSRYMKLNHPYMGRMSFPENEHKPSRTVTATKIGTSRESLIYKSEYERTGDGEYRTPTVREAAAIMGFPIHYQFVGSESAKWRLVGNAVCPCVSRSLAGMVREMLCMRRIEHPILHKCNLEEHMLNLNTYREALFDNSPVRSSGARFRKHPFKLGNITVTLSNYDIAKNEKRANRWITSVQYGNGKGFPSINFIDGFYRDIEGDIAPLDGGQQFLDIINNGFTDRIASGDILQQMHEICGPVDNFLEPAVLIERIGIILDELEVHQDYLQLDREIFPDKCKVPQRQLLALYAINKISSVANQINS